MLYDQIVEALLCSMSNPDQLSVPSCPGVYALFVDNGDALAPFGAAANGLVYIGKSSNLAQREFDTHLNSGNTGFSTLRRSIGAILKQQLKLTTLPRGRGTSSSDFTNYRFDREGEDQLNDWMRGNLKISVYADTNYAVVERDLINGLQPILNLTGWPNPNRTKIKALRKACADEARQRRPT
ncbi:GIY-YIG nuclease family protein [Paraburkholderia sp. MM6662-R1]|uniref:GIY-YIG nuclease family protein n=1 Tax=Paraburkholderia sp. MM6662-R1 TaxID=2991066 RepID=UPI003D19386C